MKISLNWLKDYVTPGLAADKFAHKLTMAGLEVEKISTLGGDTVFDLEITPNRPDCLNMTGIAREVSAILNKRFDFPKIKKLKFPSAKCDIQIIKNSGCSRYIGTLIKDVNVSMTPIWIRKRNESLGTRSINNIVDITNFCMMELGQPLHAFDFDKIQGGKIIVRRAYKDEKMITLDDEEKSLDPSMIVIADQKRAIAIAGIMGGKETQVTAETKNILLESAYFDPVLIRKASRKLGLSSDSSYRFERGVDYQTVSKGADRALSLILQSAKGAIGKRSDVIIIKPKLSNTQISLSLDKINSYLGSSLTSSQCRNIFQKLNFEVNVHKKNVFKIMPPSFRSDVKQEVDIIEEAARIIGYDNLPSSLPSIRVSSIVSPPQKVIRKNMQQLFLAQGYNEAVTHTMINTAALKRTRQQELKGIQIQNPLTQDQEILRPSMLPSLLSIIHFNVNRGQKDIRFFEMGRVYTSKGEKEMLGIIMTGVTYADWRKTNNEKPNFYDLKGNLERVLERTGIKDINFKVCENQYLEEGQRALISIGGKEAGLIGKIDAEVLDNWSIKQADVFFAELNLEWVYNQNKKTKQYVPIYGFPTVNRDISLAVKKDISAADIQQKIKVTAGDEKEVLLTELKLIEEYVGGQIPPEHRGITFSLTYQSAQDRTLRDEEVTRIHSKIDQALIDTFEVIIR